MKYVTLLLAGSVVFVLHCSDATTTAVAPEAKPDAAAEASDRDAGRGTDASVARDASGDVKETDSGCAGISCADCCAQRFPAGHDAVVSKAKNCCAQGCGNDCGTSELCADASSAPISGACALCISASSSASSCGTGYGGCRIESKQCTPYLECMRGCL